MSDNKRKFFEKNDLCLLHSYFDEDSQYKISEEERIPFIDNTDREDIWTEAIKVISDRDFVLIKRMQAKIKQSDMSIEGKRWWETIFAIAIEAPLEELERLLIENSRGQENDKNDYMSISVKKLLQKAIIKECTERRKKRQKEEERLKNLEEEVVRRWHEKDKAEKNLERHRKLQGGNQ